MERNYKLLARRRRSHLLFPELAVDAGLRKQFRMRAEGDLFLDDLSLTDFRNSLSIPVTVCPNRGEMLFEALLGPTENS